MCLQFSTKWQQRCCSSTITRESVPDPGTSCSKWAVTNSNTVRWANIKKTGRRWLKTGSGWHVSNVTKLFGQVARSSAMERTVNNHRRQQGLLSIVHIVAVAVVAVMIVIVTYLCLFRSPYSLNCHRAAMVAFHKLERIAGFLRVPRLSQYQWWVTHSREQWVPEYRCDRSGEIVKQH